MQGINWCCKRFQTLSIEFKLIIIKYFKVEYCVYGIGLDYSGELGLGHKNEVFIVTNNKKNISDW